MRSRATLPVAVIAPLLLAAGCKHPPAEMSKGPPDSSAPIAVRQVPAREISVPRVLMLSGSLIGTEEADVAAGAAGKVLSTHVERGAVVKKGAVLVRLDGRVASAQAEEAAASLNSLQAQEEQARLDCARTDQMFKKGAISKADYDKAQTACKTTKFSVAAAQARKALTAEALRDTEIRAPFSGMVVERFVSAGEYVRPDSRVVTLVDVDSLRVELTVPEADVTQIKQGMTVEFRTAANGRLVRGRVRYVGPAVRKQTRDAVIEAVVDNAGHDLRPGMFVTAELALGQQTLPAVPETAVRAEGTLRHVFLVQAGRLEDRLVQVGEAREGLVPVVSGLKPGEQVVADLTPEVRDGARVK
ncbi:MAG TPA: efflux RND transporter periplasmic adaptor subunit [Polyangia bacterium]|nr:efflux RND transporter periplasmic adaptor subunit [Polyangia bacterium]